MSDCDIYGCENVTTYHGVLNQMEQGHLSWQDCIQTKTQISLSTSVAFWHLPQLRPPHHSQPLPTPLQGQGSCTSQQGLKCPSQAGHHKL